MDDPLHLLLRFAHYGLLLGLFGLTAFRSLGLRHMAVGTRIGQGRHAAIAFALLAPFLSAALLLASVAAMMGQDIWSVEWAVVEAMIETTSIGWAFIVRSALLLFALFAMSARSRVHWARSLAAILYGGALLTLPWSGHAAATEGGIGLLHRLNGGLHLLAAGLWLGAIGWFTVLACRAHRDPNRLAPELLLNAMHRFRPLGIALVAIVALTGTINAELIFGLINSGAVMHTGYGQLLMFKIAFAGIMLVCAARHAAITRIHAAGKWSAVPNATVAAVRASLATELLIVIAVLGIVAILGMTSPMDG